MGNINNKPKNNNKEGQNGGACKKATKVQMRLNALLLKKITYILTISLEIFRMVSLFHKKGTTFSGQICFGLIEYCKLYDLCATKLN